MVGMLGVPCERHHVTQELVIEGAPVYLVGKASLGWQSVVAPRVGGEQK